ncbi:MAG: hypothetical protein ACJ71P_05995 [Nitrososphaeraceae archaeon]
MIIEFRTGGHHPTSSVWIRRQDTRRHNRHSNPGKITMNIVKDNNFKRPLKDIVTKKPNSRVMISGIAAKVNLHKLCDCPNSESGKISANIASHEPGCHIRKRLQTGRYTTNTSVTPRKISDGCSLGVVIGGEDY